jgi:LacI family transcriptional regulator, galactose operon repressor
MERSVKRKTSKMSGARQPVTMKQVAALAGVHVSTVSRALNPLTQSMVVPEAVAKVVKAAQKLGYRLDPVAASLRTGRSRIVGVLLPDISTSVFGPILAGATEQLSARGYSAIVGYVARENKAQQDFVAGLIARRVDGLILATVTREDPLVSFCIKERLPTVLVNRAEKETRLSAVVSDDVGGMQLAVDHLVELGHQRIAHLAGPVEHSTGFLRRHGFMQAMASHGLTRTRPPCEVATNYAREAGADAASKLLEKHPDITAIVAANDLLALGAYDALRGHGLRCPRDISIVGHNDMPLVDMVDPPLTTVRINPKEMGKDAAELLQQAIETPTKEPRTMVLPSKLVARESTSAPRKAERKSKGSAQRARSRKAQSAIKQAAPV